VVPGILSAKLQQTDGTTMSDHKKVGRVGLLGGLVAAALFPTYCVYYAPPVYQVFPAHYVEKIPNTWGANYAPWNGRNFDDGYSIPFPTPWITPTSTTPDPYAYEHALWNIPSTLFWEYLVHDITPPASPDHPYTENVGRAYFMVGIPALGDYAAAASLASANTAYPVESRVNKCVRIVTRSGSTITDTGEYFLVYDEHDPRNPPN
jgi:hypothetical protein